MAVHCYVNWGMSLTGVYLENMMCFSKIRNILFTGIIEKKLLYSKNPTIQCTLLFHVNPIVRLVFWERNRISKTIRIPILGLVFE